MHRNNVTATKRHWPGAGSTGKWIQVLDRRASRKNTEFCLGGEGNLGTEG